MNDSRLHSACNQWRSQELLVASGGMIWVGEAPKLWNVEGDTDYRGSGEDSSQRGQGQSPGLKRILHIKNKH